MGKISFLPYLYFCMCAHLILQIYQGHLKVNVTRCQVHMKVNGKEIYLLPIVNVFCDLCFMGMVCLQLKGDANDFK